MKRKIDRRYIPSNVNIITQKKKKKEEKVDAES